MTEEEQQQELWIVHAEQHLGREWDLPDPGKHTPYTHDYPPYSPSKVIGMLHRWRNRAWTPRQYRLARAIASNRSLRLPVLTAQAWLRRHTLLARRRGVELKMERYLGGTEGWKMRLADLESQTGVSEADIKQWLWILAPENGDVKIQRFLNSDCRKPLFLLHLLLAKDKRIQEPATFLGLLQFIRDNYVLADRPRDELNHPAYKGQGRAMTWWHFLVFLYRLVYHCREGWPAAMPLLARLAADYIGTMRLDTNARALTGYQARSLVLNKALYYLSWPARVRPIDHMEHNWAAQRHLLRLAAIAEPPLVMDQNGYRAVRTVLVALSKTKGEAKNADRAAKTWPPYRRTLDGIDERRDPEDDLSRSAKAGMLVRAAGYNDDIVDRAISALGGSTFGQAPTIQTRTSPPPFFSGAWASRNIFSEWAAQVRATRNAREAWIVFENPPEPNIRPNTQVYAEMFEKLYARLVTESPVIRPGDVKEAFPVYDANLTEFEIARLTPPSPEELYDHMLLRDNIKPVGSCLVVLVRNAPSRTAALRYLNDSPYQPSIRALREPVWKAGAESLKELAGLPSPVFNAWITMLCRLHERAPREDSTGDEPLDEFQSGNLTAPSEGSMTEQERRTREVSRGGSIPEAIALATAFQFHNTKAANHDKAPWHTIMQALAGRKILYSRLGAEFNVLETLMTFLKIYERTVASKGGDPVSFEALCLMIRKALKLTTFQRSNEGEMVMRPHITGSDVLEKMLVRAHQCAVRMFAELTKPVAVGEGNDPRDNLLDGPADGAEGENWVSTTMLRYNVVGRPIYRYMMVLACCGDHTGMVRLMDWILDGWDRDFIREEAKAPHSLDYHYMVRTIAYFAEMGKQLVEPAEMDRLQQRLEELRTDKGCTWFWPRQGLPGAGQDALLELDTDLALIERWTRLRQMVNFTELEDAVPTPASLSDISADLEVILGEQDAAASSSM
jgi:DNA (cytosine-5)-methyltransferase 1